MISCAEILADISARLDGEPMRLPADVVDAHIAQCPQCQQYVRTATLLKHSVTSQLQQESYRAQPSEELVRAIAAGVEPQRRRQASRRALGMAICRILLVIGTICYVWWALSVLFFQPSSVSGVSAATEPLLRRVLVEAAATRLGLGFGLVCALWNSRIAVGLAPVYASLSTFSVGVNMREILLGQADAPTIMWIVLTGLSAAVLAGLWLADRGLVAIVVSWRELIASSATTSEQNTAR